MRISKKIQSIKPSATLAVSAKAMDLRAQGKEIISLSVGEPDFQTPDHIKQAAKDAIDQGFTRYTQVPGIPELRQAVADYFNNFYGTRAGIESTIVTNGGKQGLYNLFQTILDPGDKVIIPAPYWVSYPAMVQLASGEPVIAPTKAENDYKLKPGDLDALIDDKTRAIILNTPSNPTGCHYSPQELDELAAYCLDNNLFIISDEIYDQLIFEPAVPASLAKWWEKKPEMVAVVNGLAKSFSMTGWRVGFVLAHPDCVKGLSKIQSQSTSNICSIAQKAALAALTGPWDEVGEMRRAFARRRDIAMEIVLGWPEASCPKPDGAFYLFPDVSACYGKGAENSTELCTLMLEKAGVALVPGTAFGQDECIRISYAVDDKTLIKALEKVGQVLRTLIK